MVTLETKEYVVSKHEELPIILQNTVAFYPFIMILPSDYFNSHIESVSEDEIMVGDAMYTYLTMNNGKLQYKLGSSVNDSPNMRYPRTADGICDWIKDCGIQCLQNLAPRYYPDIPLDFIEYSRGHLKMMTLAHDKQMEMFIPPLNKEYRVLSSNMVLCKRILNSHS
jgi:hypothetical protein